MRVCFWGTRGSIAKPGPTTVRYGGNTSCVELRSKAGTLVVLDCGTGALGLGQKLMKSGPKPLKGYLLISHTHWDHIQGLPFFAPLFVPGNEWDIYAPRGLKESVRETLAGQMQHTYFPVTLEQLGATIRYHDLLDGVFTVGDISVTAQYLNHPTLTLGYRLEADGVAVAYCCDHEPESQTLALGAGEMGRQDQRHAKFIAGADLVIHDAQYTAAEYPDHLGWGHSTAEYAVAMADSAGVRSLVLTHHDPSHDDDVLDRLQKDVRAAIHAKGSTLKVAMAAEGQIIDLAPHQDHVVAHHVDAMSAEPATAPDLASQNVLLGMVDPVTADTLWQALRQDGITAARASDSNAVTRMAQSNPPSLVLLDRYLPGLDGLNTTRALREQLGLKDVPVIIVSAQEDEAAGTAAGVTDWLIKPFSPVYARTRLRAWLLRTACRWVPAPIPADEDKRVAALHELHILDTAPEERFDKLTRIAATLFNVPVALVSMVDANRQWFKSTFGTNVCETSRDMSFCAHAILKHEVMIIPDALLDPRFAENPVVVNDPRVRFYAGCPLVLPDDSCIGTLCLIDVRPRVLDESEVKLLEDLAGLVRHELLHPSEGAPPGAA